MLLMLLLLLLLLLLDHVVPILLLHAVLLINVVLNKVRHQIYKSKQSIRDLFVFIAFIIIYLLAQERQQCCYFQLKYCLEFEDIAAVKQLDFQ